MDQAYHLSMDGLLFANLINWIVLGVVAGFLVHLIDFKSMGRGALGTIFCGMLGAMLGGVVANVLLGLGVSGFSLFSLTIAIIGGLGLALLQRSIYQHRDEYGRIIEDKKLGSRELPLNLREVHYQQVSPIGGYHKKGKDKDWLGEFTKELNYPISKRDLIRVAEDKDASRKILSALEGLPDHIYDNSKQLQKNLERRDS